MGRSYMCLSTSTALVWPVKLLDWIPRRSLACASSGSLWFTKEEMMS